MRKKVIKNIIFDFGGVLIDWNPDYVFKKLIKNKTDRDFFYNNIYFNIFIIEVFK